VASARWTLVGTPVAAGLAWYIAHTLLGHPQPFFAPTAAALSLSATRVLRDRRPAHRAVSRRGEDQLTRVLTWKWPTVTTS
jgi:uncharacterized membrane protein YgaE (UPF0421/DUF939 family)